MLFTLVTDKIFKFTRIAVASARYHVVHSIAWEKCETPLLLLKTGSDDDNNDDNGGGSQMDCVSLCDTKVTCARTQKGL